MKPVSSRSRVSNEQLDVLLSFMEEHPEFAAGKQSLFSRYSSSKLWRLLAERLNATAAISSGARKSPDKWCRYWADIKYKARKKTSAAGSLAELSHVEERLKAVLCTGGATGTSQEYSRNSNDDEDRKPSTLDDEAGSGYDDTGLDGGGYVGANVSTEELLAEAAMRSALAAEKQAEAVTQAVELLRELVTLQRREPSPAAPTVPLHHVEHHPHTLHPHHRL